MSLTVEDLTVYYRTLRGDVHGARRRHASRSPTARSWGSRASPGCGKSTLGKSLIRLDGAHAVRRRHVVARRRRPADLGRQRDEPIPVQGVSIVPQYAMSALNPIRKIGRMTSELLDVPRRRRAERCVPELERRLEARRAARRRARRATRSSSPGGMKQRVVMVLSTLLDPSLLIADEVTSALDVSTQKAVAELLVEFRDRGFVKSMIVITHDLAILYQIADTILVMYAGQAGREGAGRDDRRMRRSTRTRSCCSRRSPRSGVRYAEKRSSRASRAAAVAPRSADGLPLQGRAARSRSAKCAEEPPFVDVAPGTRSRAGRRRNMMLSSTRARRPTGRAVRRRASSSRSDDVSFDVAPRRGRLAHRRERQRQVDHRQDDPPAPPVTAGTIVVRRHRHLDAQRARA